MIPIQLSFSKYNTSLIELKGGINENVSSLEMAPGELIGCKNYMIAEGTTGGYISTKGYEQFDGITLPSKVVNYVVTLSECTSVPTVGMTLEVVETGSQLSVISSTLSSGTTYILECLPSGTPTADISRGDTIEESAVLLGTVTNLITQEGGSVNYHTALDAAYGNVIAVPGEGEILAVYIWEGLTYAFRKAVDVDEVGIYVEDDTTGWAEVTQAIPLEYSEGHHKFHFTDYNFLATSSGANFYFCDGVNKARQCDGTATTVVDNAGMDPSDAPVNIIAHNFYLWLAYPGGSLQGSTLGDPLDWTTAPVEFGLGQDITNLIVGLDSSLIITLTRGIQVLTGTTEDTFKLIVFSDEAGAYEYTAERLLGTAFFMGDQGITTMEAVDTYGSYSANSVSQRLKKTLFRNRQNVTIALSSRELNQYRLFFNNGLGIYMSFEGKEQKGSTLVSFPDPVVVAFSGVDKLGQEKIVFSSTNTDGMVFRMDSGKSFSGDYITHWFQTPYHHYKYLRSNKSFKRCTFEISGENGQSIYVRADFDYDEPTTPITNLFDTQLSTRGGNAVWGDGKWGSMIYGAPSVTDKVPLYINGIGTSLSYRVVVRDKYRGQHIIQNIITDFEILGRRT